MDDTEKKQQADNIVITALDDFLFYHDLEDIKKSKETFTEMFLEINQTGFATDREKRQDMHRCLLLLERFGNLMDKVEPLISQKSC